MDFIIQLLFILFLIWLTIRWFYPVKGLTNISVSEAQDKMKDENVVFIDVRTPEEFKSNHVKPFKNIPLAFLQTKVDRFNKDQEIVLICQSGMRSRQAAKQLIKMGYKKVFNIRGGMNAWAGKLCER